MMAWENTNMKSTRHHIRRSFEKIGSIPYFSKQAFSFQIDLNELSKILVIKVQESVNQEKNHSEDSSFEAFREADSDLFSEDISDSEDQDMYIDRKTGEVIHAKMGTKARFGQVNTTDDKTSIIQDWLFSGIQT